MIASKTVVDALAGRIRDMEDARGDLLFQTVESYQRADLREALLKLVAVRDRVCVLVPAGITYESRGEGPSLIVGKSIEVLVMVADRDLADRRAAALGSDDITGAMAMAEKIAEELMGHDLGTRGVWVEPGEGEPILISSDDQKAMGGREGWSQTLKVKVPGSRATRSRI